MSIVIDASIAAAWFLPDEQNVASDQIMTSLTTSPGRVPSLFWFEMRTIFLVAERRGRLEPGDGILSMSQLRRFPIVDDGWGADHAILTLAARHSLSGYDSSYLALALQMSYPLATADQRLASAARIEGVPLVGPLAFG